MSAFLNRLSGFNKNNVKMNVLGSSEANAGDIIQVDLPTNSIVDLSSKNRMPDVRYAANPLDYRKMIIPRSFQKDWRPKDPRRVLPRMRQIVAFNNNR